MSEVEAASLARRLRLAPRPTDAQRAASRLADLAAEATELVDLLSEPKSRALLLGIADHSPYLWRLARADPTRLKRLFANPPETSLDSLLSGADQASETIVSEAEFMRALRLAKQEAALVVALADLGGVWNVAEVTTALTRFADHAVAAALRFLLRDHARSGKLLVADAQEAERGSGVVILALGKEGAGELNYSSDVDLIVLFDPKAPALAGGAEPAPLYVRMTRSLVKLLQERTSDGYVLRVDLRLRPDPASTAVAIALPAAFAYYEIHGQNWERAALIKARPVAGDKALGAGFLADLAPFIWRKYFDYAAIADIHAMKRQIQSFRGHADIAVAGHDIKLGRGGIREIEFFVQTQQLIFGGRRPHLRGSRTLEMLAELAADGWVTGEAVQELSAAYRYLREVEHRLQMIADEQTQRLPADETMLADFAGFMGYPMLAQFADDLTRHLQQVEKHYARLFEAAPELSAPAGNLVFTGSSDDPETLETLRKLGFEHPSAASEIVRGWHFGRRSAVQSPRAREVLTELIPALLEAFGLSGDADTAIATFDAALARMPAAIELLSILRSNAKVRELFGDILGGAPRLANVIAARPHVLDAAIDPALLRSRVDEATFETRADRLFANARRTEEFLDGARDLALEESFLIGLRVLSGAGDAADAGRDYSALAASLVAATLRHVEQSFAIEHGYVPQGRCIIIGMGKLGSREMTATSDLDLIILYDFDETAPESDGRKPLHAVQYYTRLTQRLISALTVTTRRGRLYDVDMRLRPSGGKGPVATMFSSFAHYQMQEAEVWEQMALTRARVIAGDKALAKEVRDAIDAILRKPREPKELGRYVLDMRGLIAKEKGDSDTWDLKLASGGLMDIEFAAQYLVLRYANGEPAVIDVETDKVLASAVRLGLVTAEDGEVLRQAHRLFTSVTQMMRLTLEGPFDPSRVATGVLRRIALAVDLPDFPRLERELAETRREVRRIFRRVLSAS